LPASTGLGEPTLVISKLAVFAAPTMVKTVAELFVSIGSLVSDVAEIVSAICVPVAVPPLTFTTTVNVVAPGAPTGMSALVQLMTPVPLRAGLEQLHPAAPAPEITID
jgi:hypothetical protein